MTVYGDDKDADLKESLVIVSMGDSYSSGEGIPPYYGQEKKWKYRAKDQDWLAHRSKHSWSGRLKLPALEWPMSQYKDENWFFVATSGAVTDNISKEKQPKPYNTHWKKDENAEIDRQITVFERLKGKKTDYVTITIGGNDVGFANIITKCVKNKYSKSKKNMKDGLEKIWESFNSETGIKGDIKQVYRLTIIL